MPELEFRASPADLEIREDGRTVVGIAVPFNQPAVIRDVGREFVEVFRRGAFTRTIAERGAERVKFYDEHSHRSGKVPIGRATLLREDAAGLYGEFHVSKTAAGDDALELIRDGALDAFSVGFMRVPGGDSWSADRRSVARVEVGLREVSAVAFPAYAGATIAAVRSLDPDDPNYVRPVSLDEARGVLSRLVPPVPLADALRVVARFKESTQ